MELQSTDIVDPGATLTRHQWAALRRSFNLADGHSRQDQSEQQWALVKELPNLFAEASTADQEAVETEFLDAFFGVAGQRSVAELPRPSLHYSASVSIAICAAQLRARGGTVLVTHPTFDNIPALLGRHGVEMEPITVPEIVALSELPPSVSAVVLVMPNNPTGEVLEPDELLRVARICASADAQLVIDFSFRFVSDLCNWDQYGVLQEAGVDFVCIEDTGKTWPVLDLKVGIVVSSTRPHLEIRDISEDYLLNVSPFLLRLLSGYIKSDPKRSWLEIAAENRRLLVNALDGSGASVLDGGSARSIAWVSLPDGWDSDEFCRWSTERGVALCPGGPFFWKEPAAGRRFVRVALLRPQPTFKLAARRLLDLIESYRLEHPSTVSVSANDGRA